MDANGNAGTDQLHDPHVMPQKVRWPVHPWKLLAVGYVFLLVMACVGYGIDIFASYSTIHLLYPLACIGMSLVLFLYVGRKQRAFGLKLRGTHVLWGLICIGFFAFLGRFIYLADLPGSFNGYSFTESLRMMMDPNFLTLLRNTAVICVYKLLLNPLSLPMLLYAYLLLPVMEKKFRFIRSVLLIGAVTFAFTILLQLGGG